MKHEKSLLDKVLEYGSVTIVIAIMCIVVYNAATGSKIDIVHETTMVYVEPPYKIACDKGFCSKEGFTCLDVKPTPYIAKNCQCTSDGIVCKN